MNPSAELGENLDGETCKPHKKGDRPLGLETIKGYLSLLPGWKLSAKKIVKNYEFKDFRETLGFVNALAFIANRENHHPDLEVGYKNCKVRYSSHDLGGLSKNDFICAAKIDGLMNRGS